nr:hypothetical protein [Desulfobacterales bacterium]
MIRYKQRLILLGYLGLIAFFLAGLGCTGKISKAKGMQEGEALITRVQKKGPVPLYYDFEDILIPGELKLDKKHSFVFQNSNFTAGVLVFSGNVEVNSLIKFFNNNMAKDNWHLVSLFKSPRTIMLFNKQNRGCMININEKQFKCEVEIWVTPTIGNVEGGLLK